MVYLTFFADGQVRSRMVGESAETNGDVLHAETILTGTYTVEDGNLNTDYVSAQVSSYTLNGDEQFLSQERREQIQRDLLALNGEEMRQQTLSANQIVWVGASGRKVICQR